jgi:hypothetical protein
MRARAECTCFSVWGKDSRAVCKGGKGGRRGKEEEKRVGEGEKREGGRLS